LTVAVVGEFKRGKSTFINALIGHEILPEDVVPTTAVATRLTYGDTPSATLRFHDGRTQNIELAQLADYATKRTPEAAAAAGTIAEALVYYPVPFLKDLRMTLADTPGLGDDADMTRITLAELQNCDIAVMVIMADAPFAESEAAFLTQHLLTSRQGQIVFVVNGIDRLNSAADAEKVTNLVQTRVESAILKWIEQQGAHQADAYLRKFGKPKVFALSAYQALQGKLNNDADLLKRSRFDAFAAAMVDGINRERGGILLQVGVNSFIRLVIKSEKVLTNLEKTLIQHKQDFSTEIAFIEESRNSFIADLSNKLDKYFPLPERQDKKIGWFETRKIQLPEWILSLAHTLSENIDNIVNDAMCNWVKKQPLPDDKINEQLNNTFSNYWMATISQDKDILFVKNTFYNELSRRITLFSSIHFLNKNKMDILCGSIEKSISNKVFIFFRVSSTEIKAVGYDIYLDSFSRGLFVWKSTLIEAQKASIKQFILHKICHINSLSNELEREIFNSSLDKLKQFRSEIMRELLNIKPILDVLHDNFDGSNEYSIVNRLQAMREMHIEINNAIAHAQKLSGQLMPIMGAVG